MPIDAFTGAAIGGRLGDRCRACDGEQGARHTCRGSGLHAAAEAHEAGAVTPPLELPVHEVTLAFRVHGSSAFARELAAAVVLALLEHPEVVQPVTATVAGSV